MIFFSFFYFDSVVSLDRRVAGRDGLCRGLRDGPRLLVFTRRPDHGEAPWGGKAAVSPRNESASSLCGLYIHRSCGRYVDGYSYVYAKLWIAISYVFTGIENLTKFIDRISKLLNETFFLNKIRFQTFKPTLRRYHKPLRISILFLLIIFWNMTFLSFF